MTLSYVKGANSSIPSKLFRCTISSKYIPGITIEIFKKKTALHANPESKSINLFHQRYDLVFF